MAERDAPLADDAAVDGELRAGRPAIDRVRMDAARARAEQALFAVAAPARVGRYVVIDTAGAGGMGIVYRAYDPQLDRRVALKVVQAKGLALEGARERLLGEARALAQLAHPNVVPVHDVVMIDDDLVVVMEFVDGVTLDAWARERPRTPAEVLATYAQAARGLAAAHDVGVIHRDFKPGNALIGKDGRVRVVDFGLARLTADERTVAPAAGGATTTTAAGTLAYMAPEQLAGEPPTAAVDQFSFWVALYEALAGVRPFAAEDAPATLAAIRAGKLAAPGPGRVVPVWLRRAAERGLAVTPAARFPSMHAVASELVRVRGWRRWRVPVALTALTAIAGVAVMRAQTAGPPPPPPCDGGVDDIATAWGDTARAQVATALANAPGSYAREVETRTLAGLDRYRAQWMELHRHACVEHRRGALSTNLLDRSMACLQARRTALAAAAGVLAEATPDALEHAVDIVVRLPPVAACGDLINLAADAPPIADPAVRAQVAALRQRLDRATALDAAGRSTDAVAMARAVADEAGRLDQPTVTVDAELLIGRSLVLAHDLDAARPVLAHVEQLALSRGQLTAAVVAAARRIYVDGVLGADVANLEAQVTVLEPLSQAVAGDRLARPLLLNNLGVVHNAAGRRDDALRDFEAAQRAAAVVTDPDPELIYIGLNLAGLVRDPAARAAVAAAAWNKFRALLGPSHRRTLSAQYMYAHDLADPRAAWPVLVDACDRYDRDQPVALGARVECWMYRGLVADGLADAAAATAAYRRVVALSSGLDDASVDIDRALATGQVALASGDVDAASAAFQRVLAAVAGEQAWWGLLPLAHAKLGLARCAYARGDRRRARVLVTEVLDAVSAAATHNEDAEPRLLEAAAHRLAQAAR